MFAKRKTQVLIAGAGPIGLFSALLLAERGVEVMIVDEEWRTAGHAYGLTLHANTLEILDGEGLASTLLEQAHRVNTVALYDGPDRHTEIDLSVLGGRFPYLIALPQSALESTLEERLKDRGIKVLWNHRISRLEQDGDSVTATVDELGKASSGYAFAKTEWAIERSREVVADFVIGADGHRSLVRRSLGIEYESAGDPDFFTVFEFAGRADYEDLRIVLNSNDSNVLWPLPEGQFRWSFQLLDPQIPSSSRTKSRLSVQIGEHAYPYVTEEFMQSTIRERAPWFQARIDEILWSLAIRFERAVASRFGHGRVWLAGDSGHLTSPIGGQSMNIGLREAHDLVQRLTRVLRENESLERLTEGYEQARREEWRTMLGLDGTLVGDENTDPWIRDRADRLLPALPASGEHLMTLARELGLRLERKNA